ncbi:MAG: hypothetical protein P9X24_15550 [Candidatus Hatepunaea meridiana]|nr:hypothetical protein [Candidatus Hatepunaea meridiana]
MARLLFNAEPRWYEEWSLVASYYEAEFERTLREHMEYVFPDYITIRFGGFTIYSNSPKGRRADLAMINRDYKDWWIVEVEKSTDDFKHVLSQVEVFSQGIYNSIVATDYIIEQVEREEKEMLDPGKLREMIKTKRPSVLVIVDEPKPKWEKDLKKYNARLCEFQVFKNTNGLEAYRLSGKYPEIFFSDSHCRFHKTVNNLLEILSPEIFEDPSERNIEIRYNEKIIVWDKIHDGGSVFLRLNGNFNPLQVNKSYVLHKDSQGKYVLKLN